MSEPKRHMADPIVQADQVWKIFPAIDRRASPVTVLKGVSLSVAQGEMVAIMGRSGSGKSTFLHCLAGLDSQTRGHIEISGTQLSSLSRQALAVFRRSHIGFVFQMYNLIPSLTAIQNVALASRMARRSLPNRVVLSLLGQVGLADKAHCLPSALSGGQQQRVALVRALATPAQVIFADEPTGALDAVSSSEVFALLREIADAGRAIVIATHDLTVAAGCDRVIVLSDGSIVSEMERPSASQILAAMPTSTASIGGIN